MYQEYCILALTFLLSIPSSISHEDSASGPLDVDLEESFVRYPTEGGSVIVAKPLNQRPIEDPVLEDYVHVLVACLLALMLTALLGLFIRHYGLTMPRLTRSPGPGSTPQSPVAEDAEKQPGRNASQVGRIFGFEQSEKTAEATQLPVKPKAAYLKWR